MVTVDLEGGYKYDRTGVLFCIVCVVVTEAAQLRVHRSATAAATHESELNSTVVTLVLGVYVGEI